MDEAGNGSAGGRPLRPGRRGLVALALLGVAVVLGAVATGPRAETDDTPADAAAVASDPGALEPSLAAPSDPGARESDPSPVGEPPAARSGASEGAARGAATASEPVVEWASPSEPSPVEPVAPETRVPRPEAVRGIYVGSWSLGSASRLRQLIELADETEINAFVIDVKDATGEVSYASEVPLARQVGATAQVRVADIRATLDRLREHGIYAIARIVVFKDPVLANARPEWSIVRKDGSLWEDQHGVHWVDSYNQNVWDYNIELAREAVALGFGEIQWDYIRFPDVPRSYLVEAVHPARGGRSRTEAIREFMVHARDRIGELGVPLTADVFGITTSAYNDVGIGQLWEEMADVMDVLLPMVYPSHYPPGTWSYDNPNAAPYQIVRKAMDHAVSRSAEIEGAAAIRPWLQAFSLGEPEYGPRHVRAQIDAVYDAGLTEWILWNPAVRYDPAALATADGREPWFAGLGAELWAPDSLSVPEPEIGLEDQPLIDAPVADTTGGTGR